MPRKVITLNAIRNIILAFSAVLFFYGNTHALHIIGGDLSYECLGNGNYRITMNVYRDCFSQGGAPLDPAANISIFDAGSTPSLDRPAFQVPIDDQGFIPAVTDNPCLIPPSNVCVEFGTYVFDVNLPYSADGYLIVYQRCCRNTTINNITQPGEAGASYTIFLSDEAQQLCNDSPVFNEFPPIVICANEPLVFDHSATDPEGDILVYELCAPVVGATSQAPMPLTASTPNGNFPYYPTVNFINPPYSPTSPMAGNPAITIDSNTGLITGTPVAVGQFVVGVCVSEWRNGQLLGITRRDFQFNVTDCERTIIADIKEDTLIGPREYVVNSCGNNTITFINESGQPAYIEGYAWEFDLGGGNVETSAAVNPTITFPGLGTYEGSLIVNPNSPNCSDTAIIYVNVYPDINAEYSFSFDPCELAPIDFTDLSTTGSGVFTSWSWNFQDGTTSTEQNPSHLFTQAGSFDVSLTVTDINDCEDTYVQTIDWFPESQISVFVEEQTGCAPFEVTFVNNSFPINGYTTEWDLGDGTTSLEASPSHIYPDPGVYSINLTITSPTNCVSQQDFNSLITVQSSPIAAFTCTPQNPTNFAPIVTFTDQSVDAVNWNWDFGTGDNSMLQNPVYAFPDTGKYEVQLIVTHASGCQDTTFKQIDVEPRYTYFLPNAFTPNFDDINEGFRGQGIFYGIEDFEMTIWNRWGELVFETQDPNVAWNGRKNNTGAMSPIGVYVYVVKLRGARNKREEFKGYATLIR